MNDSKNARSNLTKSRWLRLSASVGLAFGLAVVMFLLPLFAGTTVTVTVPQLSSAPDSVSPANWSLTSSSVQVGLPFGVESASAVGGITVVKTAQITTAYQGGLTDSPLTSQPGEIIYTIQLTNTGSPINPPFYISDTIPTGTNCYKTDNNGNAGWSHNLQLCKDTGIAQFTLVSSTWATNQTFLFKFHVLPDGVSRGYVAADPSYYTVTNKADAVALQGPSLNGGIKLTTGAGDNVAVSTAVKAPVWQITKQVPTTVTSLGGPMTYTFDVQNTGAYTINPNVANKDPFVNSSWVTITEWVPTGVVSGNAVLATVLTPGTTIPGFTWISPTVTSTKITWVITDSKFCLSPVSVGSTTDCDSSLFDYYGQNLTVTYNTVPTLPAGYEIVNNQYMVYGGDNVSSPGIGAPMTTTVQGPGSLEVSKSSSGGTAGGVGFVVPGGVTTVADLVTYTVRFTYGSSIATVKITDTLPRDDTLFPVSPAGYVFGQLVDYVAGSVSTAGSTVPVTVTPIITGPGYPVSSLFIQGGTGVTGSIGQVQFTVRMHSFMPDGMPVQNTFEVFPVVAVITTTEDGTRVDGTNIGYVTDLVSSASVIRYSKVAFPNVVDPVSGSPNFTYTLILTNTGDNGWDMFTLMDTLNPITWAQFLGLNPDYDPANLALSATNKTTYTTGFTSWNNSTQIRVITAGTSLDDRYWLFKAKVVTTSPTVASFCNPSPANLVINNAGFGTVNTTNTAGTTASCVTVATPRISVTKVANVVSPTQVLAGDRISYTYYITNAGTVPLMGVKLTDTFVTGSSPSSRILTPTVTTLTVSPAAGSSISVTYLYTVSVNDVDTNNALLRNVVTASALADVALANPPSAIATDTYTLPVYIAKTISMTKQATYTTLALRSSAGITLPTYGDVITYVYVLTNNSTVLYGISSLVDNPLGTVVGVFPPETIAGLSVRTFTKTVTLNDALISGAVAQAALTADPTMLVLTNTASLVGTFNDSPPLLSATQYTNTVTATVQITYAARISIEKQVAAPTTTKTIGDNLAYTLFLTNTGSVTVGLPVGVLSDTLMGNTGWMLNGSPVGLPTTGAVLAPGGSTSISYIVPVTEGLAYYASLTNTTTSVLTNTAAITVNTMASTQNLTDFVVITTTPVISNQISAVTTTMIYTPSLLVSKSVNTTSATVGNILEFTVMVTNNGNVTMNGITVTDIITYEGATSPLTFSVPITSLAPGSPTSYTYNFTVTSPLLGMTFDTDKIITNTAWVTANFNLSSTYGSVYTYNTSSTITLPTSLAKDLKVDKIVVYSGGVAPAKLGDIVTYTYKVVNNSPLPITATLHDDKCAEFETGPVGGWWLPLRNRH